MDRRTFIKSAAAGAGFLAAGSTGKSFANIALPKTTTLLRPSGTPIEHVVVLMMENRSVDHYLAWWGDRPDTRFNASASGYLDPQTGEQRTLEHWGVGSSRNGGRGDHTGCGFNDPGHSNWHGFVQYYDRDGDGLGDGWLEPGSGNDEFALSTYTAEDLPVIAAMLENFTAFDNYYSAWLGPTYPNRHYMHTATAYGVWDNRFPFQDPDNDTLWWEWPTLWDVCLANQVSCAYYFSNIPFSAMYGPDHLAITRHIANFWAEAQTGQLPQVSFIDPWFIAPAQGGENDDHPHADIRMGQEFFSNILTALMTSPVWEKTALFITYDESGGFYDHVMPPRVGALDPHATDYDPFAPENRAQYQAEIDKRSGTQSRSAMDLDFGQLGARVPTFLVSPYARASSPSGCTFSGQLDHTSILGFIAENWALPRPEEWFPGESRTVPPGVMNGAFDFVNPPNPEVDIDKFVYVAPPEARILCEGRETYFDLWDMANEMEAMGFTVHTRLADAAR